ncbi:hypothetical protein HJC23_003180 [Cyclotella cryptica]|uniref:VWFA domain-containing protein n=1 Tax=Cyclotella cryptica TaxID=29204 RepID=A0ABD3PQP7_9STRA
MLQLWAFVLVFGGIASKNVAAFAPPSPYCVQSRVATQPLRRGFSSSPIRLSSPNDFDLNDDYDDEEDDEPELLDKLLGKKLGINIGSELPGFTPEEIEELRIQAQATLDKAIDGRLADIEALREQIQEDLKESKERMKVASSLNAQVEKQNLLEKIDRLTSDFLQGNADFRESTKQAAAADRIAATSGRGVDWGSWGTVGGLDVIVGSSETVERPSKLLGSVDSARRRGDLSVESDDTVSMPTENRILVVSDGQRDKGSKRVIDELGRLLDKAFDSDITIDTYSPTSNIPMGGNNAQTALIFAYSLNDRSSLENILGRVLKRTAPVAGGAAGVPPSHVVIVSSLGTERTNKMPYSMQNMFGGKLDKLREIEQAIVAISRSRIDGKQKPLDYTIVKFGEVASSDGESGTETISIQPGDQLDGEIGPNAAAQVLLQAMAFQPYARNSTLCSTGLLPSGVTIDAATWNDKFLCLSGPELLRIEAGRGNEVDDGKVLDPKFEQLAQYVKEWSSVYEGDRKGTGLTTPVLVRNSRKGPSQFDGVIAREGVRLLFQTTNTGDRYKSATEEKQDEKERNSGSGGSAVKKTSGSAPVSVKARKEGGVEVLVEKTVDGELRVRARRCNMDHKTIVKEMSEEVIVSNLKKAVKAWVDARGVTGF